MHIVSSFSARFQLEIKMPQLGSTRLGKFSARARSSRKIPARTHHYQLVYISRCTILFQVPKIVLSGDPLYKKFMIMTNTQAREFVFPGILYSVSILNLTMDFEHMHCRLQKDVLMKQIEAKLSQEMPRKTCFNPEQDHVFRAMQFAV